MVNINRERIVKGIEQATNVAIIVIALVLSAMFIKGHFISPSNERQTISAGNNLEAQPVNWSRNPKNVVLVLSTTCHFCKESAGFHQKLAQECADRHIRTIAFFPQSVEKARAYLEDEGVQVQEIWQTKMADLRVQGTPTVLLVDNHGVVQHVWTGKLPADQEKDLLARLGR
jgi:thioredoxin-related protein